MFATSKTRTSRDINMQYLISKDLDLISNAYGIKLDKDLTCKAGTWLLITDDNRVIINKDDTWIWALFEDRARLHTPPTSPPSPTKKQHIVVKVPYKGLVRVTLLNGSTIAVQAQVHRVLQAMTKSRRTEVRRTDIDKFLAPYDASTAAISHVWTKAKKDKLVEMIERGIYKLTDLGRTVANYQGPLQKGTRTRRQQPQPNRAANGTGRSYTQVFKTRAQSRRIGKALLLLEEEHNIPITRRMLSGLLNKKDSKVISIRLDEASRGGLVMLTNEGYRLMPAGRAALTAPEQLRRR